MAGTTASPEALAQEFLGWQCRIRQHAVRRDGGRPSSGMRPQVFVGDGADPLGRIVVLIVKRDWEEPAARLRFMAEKTHDPADRYDAALKYLQADYYQKPGTFSEQMTALFGAGSGWVERLLDAERCVLSFDQYGQAYRLRCAVRALSEDEGGYQLTYWHNRLFNPAMPGDVRVLGFMPDFAGAQISPGVE
ncbi:MAG: hypothetical protein OER43_12025 [Gammaproteobacteria bacterium]|nr:hypothetical protein [Gammaproteobacteria bacterium]MDH3413420.1 hypothetical protein [Gammaproteobacteria bacterium]